MYFLATDIHGSAYWANRVVEKFKKSNADTLILLGDIYNHGPRNPFPQDYAPMQVAETLSQIKNLIVVQGNCDSEVDQMISNFQFVRENVVILGNRKLFFTHGHVHNKDSLPCLSDGDVMFYGHTHINEITEREGIVCVNVGSCALPKDGHNVYCLIDEKGASIYDFYDNLIAQKLF